MADRVPVRIVLEDGRGRAEVQCNGRAEWTHVVEVLRQRLVAQTTDDRCASVTVSVHFQDERCDHA